MDFILEIIITIIFEGTLELTTSKRVPLLVRVIAAVLLLSFYIGLVGILFYIGLKHKSWVVIGCAVFVFALVAIVAIKKYHEMKRH